MYVQYVYVHTDLFVFRIIYIYELLTDSIRLHLLWGKWNVTFYYCDVLQSLAVFRMEY